jgi:hypothetical protein
MWLLDRSVRVVIVSPEARLAVIFAFSVVALTLLLWYKAHWLVGASTITILHRYASAFPTWIGAHLQSISGGTDISLLTEAAQVAPERE